MRLHTILRFAIATIVLAAASHAVAQPAADPAAIPPGANLEKLKEAAALLPQLDAAGRGDIRQHIALRLRYGGLLDEALGADHPLAIQNRFFVAELQRFAADYESALQSYQRVLASYERTVGAEHPDYARVLNGLGQLHSARGDTVPAEGFFKRSLAIWEKAGGPDHVDVATALNNLGDLYGARGRFAEAEAYLRRALDIREKGLGPEHPLTASSLNNLGALLQELGRYGEAMPLYQRSLAIKEQALGPDHPAVAGDLNNLATLFGIMGEFDRAELHLRRALAINEKNFGPSHPDIALGLGNLGRLFIRKGEFREALPLYRKSLEIRERIQGPGHPDVARNLNNLAEVHRALGEYAEALALQRRSLDIYQTAFGPEHPDIASVVSNMMTLHLRLGDYARAEELGLRALAIREKAYGREHPSVAISLNNLGSLYNALERNETAVPYYERALAISRKVHGPEHPEVARYTNNLAFAYDVLGDPARAEALYQQGLAITERVLGPLHPETATGLNNLATVRIAHGGRSDALQLARRALVIVESGIDPDLRRYVLATVARILAGDGNAGAAIFFGKHAVNALQGLRANVLTLEREIQKSFVTADKIQVYRELANLLIAQGRLAEARQVLGMLKEEEFFDFVRRDSADDPRTRRIGFSAPESEWEARYRERRERLADIGARIERARRNGLPQHEPAQFKTLETDAVRARQSFLAVVDELIATLRERIAQQETPEFDGATRDLQSTLDTIGNGAVTLHYLVMPDRVRILLTTPRSQIAREGAITEKELASRIQRFRDAVQDPRRNPLPLARGLYQVLIEPIEADLRASEARTIMLSLDGALRYLPFAALHDGTRYLAESYRLTLRTEAVQDTRLKELPRPDWRITGLGVTRGIEDFAPLPAVRAEFAEIVRATGRGVLPGEVYLDEAFTAERFKRSLAGGFPVVHVASHFVFKPGTEADSFLLLGDGNRLSLYDIKRDGLRFEGVDLLTLSACETALGGGRDATGREVEGLGALAQKQGAKGVIATLWPVADESTARFMAELYRVRESRPGVTKAEALQSAQLSLLRGDATTGIRSYAHPFFWAPFILMGNWL